MMRNPQFSDEPPEKVEIEIMTTLKGIITMPKGSSLQSSNYVAGTSGWILRGDGTHEFN